MHPETCEILDLFVSARAGNTRESARQTKVLQRNDLPCRPSARVIESLCPPAAGITRKRLALLNTSRSTALRSSRISHPSFIRYAASSWVPHLQRRHAGSVE